MGRMIMKLTCRRYRVLGHSLVRSLVRSLVHSIGCFALPASLALSTALVPLLLCSFPRSPARGKEIFVRGISYIQFQSIVHWGKWALCTMGWMTMTLTRSVLSHSLVRSLICSLVCLLRTARFARALPCTQPFARWHTPLLTPSHVGKGFLFMEFLLQFQSIVQWGKWAQWGDEWYERRKFGWNFLLLPLSYFLFPISPWFPSFSLPGRRSGALISFGFMKRNTCRPWKWQNPSTIKLMEFR